MAFKIKGVNKILNDSITWVSTKTDKITDFNPGSAVRTLLESVSLQIEEFYYDLEKAVKYAIKNAGYEAFNFNKNGSKQATGHVTIFYEQALREDVIIPNGSQFHTGTNRIKKTYYRSTQTIKVLKGAQSAIIPIVCEEYGSIGNAVAGEISKMVMGSANIYAISNTTDIVNGIDEETEAQRELRFREYVHTLQRGTAEAIIYGIKQVPGVAGVYIDDNYVGYVRAYVHDKDGNLTDDLKSKVLKEIEKYRSGGIEVEVRPIVKITANISMSVWYNRNVNETLYNSMITSAIYDYLTDLKTSESLNMSSLISYLYDNFREAISYIDIESHDIHVKNNELIVAGSIEVNTKDYNIEEGY